MAALRPGRKVSIHHPGLEPVEVTIIGRKPRVSHNLGIAETGELVVQKVVQFYSDYGTRTVDLAQIRVR